MQITVTTRHCDVSDEVKERAEQLVTKLAKLVDRPIRASVIFDEDHNRKLAELHFQLPRGRFKIASAEAVDFRTALDRAADKLRNQLERISDRVVRKA